MRGSSTQERQPFDIAMAMCVGLSGRICHHNTSELRFHLLSLYWTYQQFIWFLLVMEYNFQELETLNFIHVQWVSNQKKDHWELGTYE